MLLNSKDEQFLKEFNDCENMNDLDFEILEKAIKLLKTKNKLNYSEAIENKIKLTSNEISNRLILLTSFLRENVDEFLFEYVDTASEYDDTAKKRFLKNLLTNEEDEEFNKYLMIDETDNVSFNKKILIMNILSSCFEYLNYQLTNNLSITNGEDKMVTLFNNKSFDFNTFYIYLKNGNEKAFEIFIDLFNTYIYYNETDNLYQISAKENIKNNPKLLKYCFEKLNPYILFEYQKINFNINNDNKILNNLLNMVNDVISISSGSENRCYSSNLELKVDDEKEGTLIIEMDEVNEALSNFNMLYDKSDELFENFDNEDIIKAMEEMDFYDNENYQTDYEDEEKNSEPINTFINSLNKAIISWKNICSRDKLVKIIMDKFIYIYKTNGFIKEEIDIYLNKKMVNIKAVESMNVDKLIENDILYYATEFVLLNSYTLEILNDINDNFIKDNSCYETVDKVELLSTHLRFLLEKLKDRIETEYDESLVYKKLTSFLTSDNEKNYNEDFLTEFDFNKDANFNKKYIIMHIISSVYENINYLVSNGLSFTNEENTIYDLFTKDFNIKEFLKLIQDKNLYSIMALENLIENYFKYNSKGELFIQRCRVKLFSNSLSQVGKKYNPFSVFEYSCTENMSEDVKIISDLLYMNNDINKNIDEQIYKEYNPLYINTNNEILCIDTTEVNEEIRDIAYLIEIEELEYMENETNHIATFFCEAITFSLINCKSKNLKNKVIRVIMKYFSLLKINEYILAFNQNKDFYDKYLENEDKVSDEFIEYIIESKQLGNIILSVLTHPDLEEEISNLNSKSYIKK